MNLRYCAYIDCKKPISEYKNYCNFDCMINEAKLNNGKVIAPNNLPIKCIRGDGTMLEHEHADHSTYLFPIEVECKGDHIENHALIYTDGCIAISLYECCYCYWHISPTESSGSGSLWKNKEDWTISKASRDKIFNYCKEQSIIP